MEVTSHGPQVVAPPTLKDSNRLHLVNQIEGLVARRYHRLVCRHHESLNRQQALGHAQQFVAVRVFGHRARLLQHQGIRLRAPQERNDGKVEDGHIRDVHRETTRLRDPLCHPQRRIQRAVRVDLDHHLETRLDHMAWNLGVRRLRKAALVHLRRNGVGLARDFHDIGLAAIAVEARPDPGNPRVGGLPGRHEHPEQRFLARDQQDRKLARLDGLGQVGCGRLAIRAERDPALVHAFQPSLEVGVRGRAQVRSSGLERFEPI